MTYDCVSVDSSSKILPELIVIHLLSLLLYSISEEIWLLVQQIMLNSTNVLLKWTYSCQMDNQLDPALEL